jgi:hypothetical protein
MVRSSCLVIASCAAILGCGSTTTPSSSSLAGEWTGTTSQGTPISFTVSADQKVTAITVGYNFSGCSGVQRFSNLNLETAPNVTCIPGPCPPSLTSYRAFNYVTNPIETPVTSVNGFFTTTSRAEGVVAFRDYPGCGSAVGVTWIATKR